MRNDEHSAFVFFKRTFKRLTRIYVQMVRGFVQQQKVGSAQHQLQQLHPCHLAAGKLFKRLEHIVPAEKERRQRAAYLRIAHAGIAVAYFLYCRYFAAQPCGVLLIIPRVNVRAKVI